jgi:SAM-dependent methyltransferase
VTEAEAQQRARATWSAGDFNEIAKRISAVGVDLVERVGVGSGDRVLDVACGTGNATIPAAQAGGDAVGLDITPELLEDGRRNAADAGVEIEWVEGDAEALPFEDDSFDVVLSTFGCMFAPDHRAAATEIARVTKPGGRVGLACWRPDGNIGRMFAAVGKYAPPPPEGFQPPPLWGVRDHVTEIFDGTGVALRFEDTAAHFKFDSVDEVMDEFPAKFGPMVMLRAAIEPEGRWPAFLDDLRAMYEAVAQPEDGGIVYDGEYLITLGEKTG